VPVAQQLLGGLEVARVQVTHQDLKQRKFGKTRKI
jgi:hypothetical protein